MRVGQRTSVAALFFAAVGLVDGGCQWSHAKHATVCTKRPGEFGRVPAVVRASPGPSFVGKPGEIGSIPAIVMASPGPNFAGKPGVALNDALLEPPPPANNIHPAPAIRRPVAPPGGKGGSALPPAAVTEAEARRRAALEDGVARAALYHAPACVAARNMSSYRSLQLVVPWEVQEARLMETGGLAIEFWKNPHGPRPRTVYIRNQKVCLVWLACLGIYPPPIVGCRDKFTMKAQLSHEPSPLRQPLCSTLLSRYFSSATVVPVLSGGIDDACGADRGVQRRGRQKVRGM